MDEKMSFSWSLKYSIKFTENLKIIITPFKLIHMKAIYNLLVLRGKIKIPSASGISADEMLSQITELVLQYKLSDPDPIIQEKFIEHLI